MSSGLIHFQDCHNVNVFEYMCICLRVKKGKLKWIHVSLTCFKKQIFDVAKILVIFFTKLAIFSSPEPKAQVSYSHPSVNFFFKRLLFQNY